MKKRKGFVSNSSTSSFLIMGTDSNDLINELIIADGLNPEYISFEYGMCRGKNMVFIESGCMEDGERVAYAGIEIDNLLEDNNLKQLRIEFVNIAKRMNVDVDICNHRVNMFHGECGTG